MPHKKKKSVRFSKKLIAIVFIAFIIILTTCIVWDTSSGVWRYDREGIAKFSLAQPINYQTHTVNDASQLNPTTVAQIYQPTSVEEIQRLVLQAKEQHKHIAISGVRHSMGGQASYTDALQSDMTKFDAISYNADQTVTVQSGATWQQVQAVLNPKARAIAVMQDSNIFSVGGSVSVNAHGKDPHFGPLISTINYIKMIDANGQEITLSRDQNPQLFKAVIGGYGMFGVITAVNLQTVPNNIYAFSLKEVLIPNLLNEMETQIDDGNTHLVEAHFSIDTDNLFAKSLIYSYKKTDQKPATTIVPSESNILLRKSVFGYSKNSNVGKTVRWELEKALTPGLEPKYVTRNMAMSAPVRFLKNDDTNTTDILQEYFIPKENFYLFLSQYKQLLHQHTINITNLTLRTVKKDTESLLPYAIQDMYAFVAYYTINKDASSQNTLSNFTQQLIATIIADKGTYYLPYGSYYTPTQLQTMYPNSPDFKSIKTQNDPEALFMSTWYEKYFE